MIAPSQTLSTKIFFLVNRIWQRRHPTVRCTLCAGATRSWRGLCDPCLADLPWLGDACYRCALPMAAENTDGKTCCGQCLQQPPAYDRCISATHYGFPLPALVQGLKYQGMRHYGPPLGYILLESLKPVLAQGELPELIIPVPLHGQRLRTRGFNQATEIARVIARQTGIPLKTNLCRRTRATARQMELPAAMRKSNVRLAFEADQQVAGKGVLVIDDVVTTGQTVNGVALALRAAGAARVLVASVARTPRYC